MKPGLRVHSPCDAHAAHSSVGFRSLHLTSGSCCPWTSPPSGTGGSGLFAACFSEYFFIISSSCLMASAIAACS